MDLNDKIAIVTGSGRGIGKAISLELAKEGVHVVLCSRTEQDLKQTLDEIQHFSKHSIFCKADVTNKMEVRALIHKTVKKFGRIDILVNNAGGTPTELYNEKGKLNIPEYFWDESEEFWDKILETNLKSVFLCSKYTIPFMIEQQCGDIINIASKAGRIACPFGGAYPSSKAAVISLTKTMALQTRQYGIRVNAISPGPVDTPGQRKLMAQFIHKNQYPKMDNVGSVSIEVVRLLNSSKMMTGQSLDLFVVGESN